MNGAAAYLLNFCVHATLVFLITALLIEGGMFLCRVKNARLKYWLRMIPFIKLPLLFLNYTGTKWLFSTGQTILEQPEESRTLMLSLGWDKIPYFDMHAQTKDNLYFGLGDVMRELLGASWVIYLTAGIVGTSFCLLVLRLFHASISHRKLVNQMKNASLVLPGSIPVFESSSTNHSPLLFGFARPKILLPSGLKEKLSTEELLAIVEHEKSHARWKDPLFACALEVIVTLFWFIPNVKRFYIGLLTTREIACDRTTQPDALARAICKTIHLQREKVASTALSFISQQISLTKRIQTLTSTHYKQLKWGRKILYGIIVTMTTIFVLSSTVFPF